MSYHYLCPHCGGHLRANNKLILSAQTSQGQRGLILLSPQVGNYEILVHPTFELIKGDLLKLFCPVCHANLQFEGAQGHLARIIMRDEFENEYRLLFSEIVGEHATYQLCNEEIRAYGEDQEHYLNHFGETFADY